jgi:hypothetical protein
MEAISRTQNSKERELKIAKKGNAPSAMLGQMWETEGRVQGLGTRS